MKHLKNIIELILSGISKDEIINHLGILFKVVGRIYVIKPQENGIESIGLVTDKDKICSADITLIDAISFNDLTNEFSSHFKWRYNHYDEETVVSFYYSKKLTIRGIKEGYIDEVSLINQKFKRFEIDLV